MSDTVSRDAVLHALQEWTYCCDAEDVVRALPAVQPDARIKQYEESYQYALHLAEALRENYPPNPDFRFLGDLAGLLTQIDNMVAGLSQTAVQLTHVNETPKIEHDARDVLTPATKGGGA